MNDKKQLLFSILLGIGSGIVMALVVLFCMIKTDCCMTWVGLGITCLSAGALPWLLDEGKKNGWHVYPAEMVMTAVSFGITILYAFQVTGSVMYAPGAGDVKMHIIAVSGIAHGISVIMTMIRMYLTRKRG